MWGEHNHLMGWLEEATQAVAEAVGLDARELELSTEAREEILDLARVASHTSGDRINAPLLCYVLGIAAGKGADLEVLAGAVRSHSGS
jgi:hypothetical protein